MYNFVKKSRIPMLLSLLLVFFTLAPMMAFATGNDSISVHVNHNGNAVVKSVYHDVYGGFTKIDFDLDLDSDVDVDLCSGLDVVGQSSDISLTSGGKLRFHGVETPSGNLNYWVKFKGNLTADDLKFLIDEDGHIKLNGPSCTGGTGGSCSLSSLSGASLKASLKDAISLTENTATGKGVAHIKLPENCEIKLTLSSYVYPPGTTVSADGKPYLPQILFDSKTVTAKGDTTIEVNLPQFGPYQLDLYKGDVVEHLSATGHPADRIIDWVVKPDWTVLTNAAKLKLDALCSTNIATNSSFKVTNSNNIAVPFNWEIAGSGKSGTGTVDANGTVNFDTNVPGLASNSVINLYVNGVLQGSYTGMVPSCPAPSTGGGSTGGTNTGGSTGGTGTTVVVIPDTTTPTTPAPIDTLANATVIPAQPTPDVLTALSNAMVLPYQETAVPNGGGMQLSDSTGVTPSQDSMTAADSTSQAPDSMTVLPQTGESLPISYYIVGLILILLGTLLIRARKTN
jgi:LPXTG-motif cell wall-anchored protein